MKKGSNPPPPEGVEKPGPPPAPPRAKSGRGGLRVAGRGKALGAPRKDPAALTVVKGPYRFPPDVAEILATQRNATRFICEAIRGGKEFEAVVAYCRCGVDYVILNERGDCPNGCERASAKLGEPQTVQI